MKIRDDAEWQLLLAQFAADPDPEAKPFKEFLIAWAEQAEAVIELRASEFKERKDPIQALRSTLGAVEREKGRVTSAQIGMMLMLLSQYWGCVDPDRFYDSLNPIEAHLFIDMALVKMAELNKQAQEATQGASNADR